MRIKEGFQLREVCGEFVIVAHGDKNIDFSRIIHLNESAAVIWKAVCRHEFTIEDMARAMMAEYDVTEATALTDAGHMADSWKEAGLTEQ